MNFDQIDNIGDNHMEGTKAAGHRSPIIEESGEHRLLLRIDTNNFIDFG
ncbi:hypothetical protein [Putridiphycobacter roseus]|nr:hypothetical protein [Putridiphycobacter roseus]